VTIYVTGVGAITALGMSARETFDRILTGERGFSELSLFDPGEVRTRIVAEIRDLGPCQHSRTSDLAVHAAREAIAQAGLDVRSRRVGLVLAGTTAGMFETESLLATLLSNTGEARERALSRMLSHPLSAPTDRLAAELGPFTRVRSLSSACSGGANAIAVAASWLELGLVDAVLCGGADSLCRVTVTGFNALGALDPNGARPFDVSRRGLTLGEGAGMLVLEREAKHAVCTLLGWAARSEAHHITNPEPSGRAPLSAMRAALERAGLAPDAVGYVNAHGTGTPLNDPMETRALAQLFGEALPKVPVSSQKGMIGHTLAAAGAVEAIITALAIERGVLPPTGGLTHPDPECALRHVFEAEERPIRAAISSSFGFGGMDTALVFADREHTAPPRTRHEVVIRGIAAVTPAGIFTGTEVADLPSRMPSAEDVVLPEGALDPERARRLDRTSRLAAVACRHAGAISGGVILGSAFGAVDGTAHYMRRLTEKGARLVRPADFPTLVPSSPAGFVSIYLGLDGPALVVADLAVSGESAFTQAWELIATGDGDQICTGAVEERSAIVDEVLSIIFAGRTAPRREGAAAILLGRPGPGALARIGDVVTDLAALPTPPEGAIVVLGGMHRRETDAWVDTSGWAGCPRITCSEACGAHEAAGSIAIAVAAAKVARGEAPAALFAGIARGRGYAGTIWPV
jgi:3-oxoacyl-[acyl-carrier-protein] synthase II